MTRTHLKDPLLLGYMVLSVVLLPVIVLLAEQYPSYAERIRRAAGPPRYAQMPSDERLVEAVTAGAPAIVGLTWELVYRAAEEPRTGIARVYDLTQGEERDYTLVLFRHDIACDLCRDLLAGVLYHRPTHTWGKIVLLEPFERKGEVVDPQEFLEQFVGQPVTRRFALGQNVDGITGATRSVNALIQRLHETAAWLESHPAGAAPPPQAERPL